MARTANKAETPEETKVEETTAAETPEETKVEETTAVETPEETKDSVEYVDHAPLFRDGEKYKNPLNVTINGVKYSVPRGVPLRLPKVVAEVIDQSIAQDAYAAELDRKMQEAQVTVF